MRAASGGVVAGACGEGGGLLTNWLVAAAKAGDLPVQSTSIPGVAQRTGATTYYLEVVPTPTAELNGQSPVLSLYPGPGNMDIVVASELLEAGRAIENGFVSPDRTTLIASTPVSASALAPSVVATFPASTWVSLLSFLIAATALSTPSL